MNKIYTYSFTLTFNMRGRGKNENEARKDAVENLYEDWGDMQVLEEDMQNPKIIEIEEE